MDNEDNFGRDPQIRYMRRVFAGMEKAQATLLKKLDMTVFDERLRRFRDIALKLFERTWPLAIRKGIVQNEEEAAVLYMYCLSHVFATRGIEVPRGTLPAHRTIEEFAKEALE